MKLFKLSNKNFLILFIGLFIFHVSLFFPGLLSSDSLSIYSEALKNNYSLHHPPFMALTWHFLNMIYEGPALMYLFNLVLLWSAIYILCFKIFNETYIKLSCLALPFIPHILVYSGWIWKDILFSYGYILIAVNLALKTIKNEKLGWKNISILTLSLIYFTEVKYQAQFVLPFVLFWMFQLHYPRNIFKTASAAIIFYIMIMTSISYLNNFLISEKNQPTIHGSLSKFMIFLV
tara:strand:- start:7349 stop:8047 length:699 start_codon:yes stop_codon:yes gene_type:complete